jgi:putative membrane-bound dehydrogenase-like protein
MRRLLLCLLLVTGHWSPATASDKPVPAADAAAKMKLPPGFKVTLFAGEPDVVQPIAFTFDDRGRMWVVECLMYPKWSQDGKGGKDRVVILEDTDGDGKHDKKTVVLDDGVNLSGIELGFGGMYLCSSPNLIFVPIKDDKPGKAEVLLDGWNIKEAKHNVFNGLVWGPDGWLYGCNGIQTKSKVGKPGTPDKDRIPFDCGVWRFHPTRKVFEVVATGTTNPWGLDFDEHGEMFITNCVIDHLFHVVPGGRYTRMYGQDYNPHTYGYMGSAVDYKHWGGGHWTESRADKKTGALVKEHDDAGGGHAHSGAAIYLGDNFPKEYRNTLFTANIHGNRLNNDGLERTKTGMKGVRRPDFLFANDPWFRGICVKQGPAGELFVSDWCDTGECHNYDVADTSNGRIYRVTYGDLKPFKGDVSKMTDEELVKAQLSTNEWLVRRARLRLQMRASENADAKKTITDLLMKLSWDQDKPITRNYERRVWALQAVGGIDRFTYDDLARDDHSNDWFLRFGVENDYFKAHQELEKRLMSAESVAERKKLVSIYMRRPHDGGNVWLTDLTAKPTDDNDLAWLTWFAAEPTIARDPYELVLYNVLPKCSIPLVRQNMVRRFVSAAENDKAAMELLAAFLLDEKSKDDLKRDILLGIRAAYADQPAAKPLPRWGHMKFDGTAEVRALADELSIKFGDPKKIDAMKDRVLARAESANARRDAIRLLAGAKVPDLAPLLRDALADDAVRGAAIRALAAYPDDKTPSALLEMYGKLSGDEKADAVQTLSSRAAYASALLDAVEKGTVPKGDITAFTARQIAGLKDKAVTDKLAKVWGEVKTGTANAKAKIAEYKTKLTPDAIARGDAAKGKVLFGKACGTCHKLFGEGQAVGPELTGSQRGNLDYVLENVVDPNAVVPFDYKMTQFYLKDGRQLSGLVKGETPQTVTVRTVNEEVVIAKADIDERKPTNNSVMPEGLFDALKPDELRDLMKYLTSKDGK